jgi:hypothetical protein
MKMEVLKQTFMGQTFAGQTFMGQTFAGQTKRGVIICRGCFTGTVEEFLEAVKNKHSNNSHADAYRFAIKMFMESFKARGIDTEPEKQISE